VNHLTDADSEPGTPLADRFEKRGSQLRFQAHLVLGLICILLSVGAFVFVFAADIAEFRLGPNLETRRAQLQDEKIGLETSIVRQNAALKTLSGEHRAIRDICDVNYFQQSPLSAGETPLKIFEAFSKLKSLNFSDLPLFSSSDITITSVDESKLTNVVLYDNITIVLPNFNGIRL
jgi:hypothetical protein